MDTPADYIYAIEVLRGDRTVATVPVTPDFAPAIEAVRLAVLRQGARPDAAFAAGGRIEPRWHESLGQPYLAGLRVSAAAAGHALGTVDVPLRFFADHARGAIASLVTQGLVQKGESVAYLVTAYPRRAERGSHHGDEGSAPGFLTRVSHGGSSRGFGSSEDAADGAGTALDGAALDGALAAMGIEELPIALELRDQALDARLDQASPAGAVEPGDHSVLIERQVLEEAKAMADAAGEIESGGLLVGHLCRDSGRGDVFLDVTDLLPARHTQASLTSLTFTPDTWWDARAALALRRRGEIFLGWVHSHPVTAMCRRQGCSEEAQRHCRMARDFFSEHDRLVHRAMFPRAHTVALVVNEWHFAPSSFSLFGYRGGLIESRGFHVVNGI